MATGGKVSGSRGTLRKAKRVSDDDNNNKEQVLFPFEASKLPLAEFIQEWNKRILARFAVFEKNRNVEYEEFQKLVKEKKLDSNLKKCTAFVRKMRQFSEASKTSLEGDVRILNLTKYISEIALVVAEIRVKPTDMASLVSVCSEIHARYPTFSEQLMGNFTNILEINDLAAAPKLGNDLHLFKELLLAGILPTEVGSNVLLNTVHVATTLDKSCTQLLPTVVTFLRDYTEELIGGLPRDVRVALETHHSQVEHAAVAGLKMADRDRLKATLKKYFLSTKSYFVKENDHVWGSAKRLRKLLEKKGDIPPDLEKAHQEKVLQLEKYHHQVEKLANLLDLQPPKIRHLSINPEDDLDDSGGTEEVEGIGKNLFEDEETKQFYQDLPDLKTYLFEKKNGLSNSASVNSLGKTGDTLEKTRSSSKVEQVSRKDGEGSEDDPSSSSEDSGADSDSDSDSDSSSAESFDSEAEMQELLHGKEPSPRESSEDILPSSRYECEDVGSEDVPQEEVPSCSTQPRISFPAYLKQLQNCVNVKMIDQAGYDFVDNFKSRKCKQEFARHVFSLPRKRLDLLRLFSRLIATVSQVHPEIGDSICELLRKDFRFLVLKRDHYRLDAKLKTTRFIGELIMFSVFSKVEAFNCFKLLLRNFSHQQIDMTCCFLETCGRFLYQSRDSHRKMKLYLDEMLRRKTTQFLEPRYAYQIDYVYHLLRPSSGGSLPRIVKTPLHAFMEYVLCFDLKRDTLERANKALRMFDWKDPAKSEMAIGVLSAPWRLNHSQWDIAAALLVSVKTLLPHVVLAVIENISEVVRLGCEFESEDMNNMRMAACQYLAHLYNYKCLTTASLLNVMYYLISYGVSYQDGVFSRMDPPDSLYRVRVICLMLRIVGTFVSTPRSNRRLDCFLTYFQRYYCYKKGLSVWEEFAGRKQFPHYVQEMFEDTMRKVRGKWQFVNTMADAEQVILELDKRLRERVKSTKLKRAITGEGAGVQMKISPRGEGNPGVGPANAATGRQQDLFEAKDPKPPVFSELAPLPEEKEEEEEEDDFEKELQAMCSEATGSREQHPCYVPPRKPVDVPTAGWRRGGCRGAEALPQGSDKVKVTVLTKKDNKPREKMVEVEPVEDFLVSIKEREEQEKKEIQQVKKRTLELTRRQQEEEQHENDRSMMDALRKLGNVTNLSPTLVASAKRSYHRKQRPRKMKN